MMSLFNGSSHIPARCVSNEPNMQAKYYYTITVRRGYCAVSAYTRDGGWMVRRFSNLFINLNLKNNFNEI